MEHTSPVVHQRRIHYVDESIQKGLLVGLVLLEMALAAGLAWLMYRHLSAVVEDNLYIIHMAEAKPLATELLHAALKLFGLFVLVNVVALVAVDVLWRRYVDGILSDFGGLMRKTAQLDFSADAPLQRRHQLLDLAEQQRSQDRARLTAVHAASQRLIEAQQAGDGAAVQQALKALDEAIPQGRATRPDRRVGRSN